MAGLLKKLFSSNSSQKQNQTLASDLPPLTDSDFEFLLDQLLQGIAHGWQPDRLETFIFDLGTRGKSHEWEQWLSRFSTRILTQAQAAQQRQIGSRLLYVGNALNNSPKLHRLAKAFAQIGQQLVTGHQAVLDLIWEYDGGDRLTNADMIDAVQIPPEILPILEPTPVDRVNPITTIPTTTQIQATATTQIQAEIPPAPEPKSRNLSSQQLEELFNQGLAKADRGNFEGAIADWDEVLKINDQIPQVWHNRGSALGCLGQFEAALECFDKAIAIAPDSVVAWKDRSYAFMKLEQWQAALDSWNHTIELRDDVAEAWYQRGCTLERLNKFENALINYRKAVELAPDFEQAQQRLKVLESGIPLMPIDPWTPE